MQNIVKWTFYPLCVLSAMGLALLMLSKFESTSYMYIPIIIAIIFLFPLLIFEKVIPFKKNWQTNKGDLISDIVGTFFILPLSAYSAQGVLNVFKPLYPVYNFWNVFPSMGKFIVALLLSEFCYYWVHRAFHRFNVLWRFHAVHHGIQRIYSINAGKFHLVEAFFSSIAYFLPIFLLGIPTDLMVLIITLSLISGFLEHVNVDYKTGFLNYIFNTAEHHRWHHSIDFKESYNNFGKVLSIWDIYFGTFFLPQNKNIQDVGIENETISNSFYRQLIYPFKKGK